MPVKLIEGTQTKIDYTPVSAASAGDVVSKYGVMCILSVDLAAGELGSLNLPDGDAIYRCPKENGVVFAAGDVVGFDISADTAVVSGAGASDGNIGIAVGGGLSGDLYVDIWHTLGGVSSALSVAGVPVTRAVLFSENATNTTHTGTIEIPAGAFLQNIQIVNKVLWGATSASLDVGDLDDPDGWFATVDLKATDLLVGEVLDITNAENWGGTQGAYLVAATGRKGRTTAGIDSGIYYGAACEVVGTITVGTPAVTTGRTLMAVTYVVPAQAAAVGSGP